MPLYLVTATKTLTLSMYVLADDHDHADEIAEEVFDEEQNEVVEPPYTFESSSHELQLGDAIDDEWFHCAPYGERKNSRFALGKTWEGEGEPDR